MCRWRAGPKSSAICPTASPRVRWRTRRRLPCNRHDRLRTCWCVKAFRCNIARPAHFHSEGGRLRRRGRSGLGWGVFPHSRAAPELAERSLVRNPMCTSTSGCCGSGGNETARSSAASPTRPRSAAAKLRRYVVLAVPLHPTDLADGWLYRTSRRDGYLYLTDRAKDVIITGSSNVYPREVEEVLLTHPQVREVAVIGVPDCEWGESVCAVIVPASILRAVRIGL